MSFSTLKRKNAPLSSSFSISEKAQVEQPAKMARPAPTTENRASNDVPAASYTSSRAMPTIRSPQRSESNDEDDGNTMQRVVEQIKLATMKKSSKHMAKVELIVDEGLKKVETTVSNALREEEHAFRSTVTQLHNEFKRVTSGLQQWSNDVHQLNESYNISMRSLASQFDKLTRSFAEQLNTITKDALSESTTERRSRVQRECRSLVAQIKSQLQSAPEPSKNSAQTAMLLQALMNSMN